MNKLTSCIISLAGFLAVTNCSNQTPSPTIAIGNDTRLILPKSIHESSLLLEKSGFDIDAKSPFKVTATRINNPPFSYTNKDGSHLLVKTQSVVLHRPNGLASKYIGPIEILYSAE